MELKKDEKILACVPTRCAGPGWANTPIVVIIGNHTTKEFREEFIQPEDQTPEMMWLFSVCESAHNSMLRAVAKKEK